ncbi:hypothetical protein C7974DRAFT_402542 [Boeremia exigua]|uniref:uncharacterized protein n=1 Tax=Boeremia exigua TaxID=749465 RepID=UPI001E8DA65B|nr:uncharacterized protein C7974DRAFT_402542 [Boeremia exigua]KAH6616842.1 hypothetical protein C7974DRAFT_402542 [Boeremia exigua]
MGGGVVVAAVVVVAITDALTLAAVVAVGIAVGVSSRIRSTVAAGTTFRVGIICRCVGVRGSIVRNILGLCLVGISDSLGVPLFLVCTAPAVLRVTREQELRHVFARLRGLGAQRQRARCADRTSGCW